MASEIKSVLTGGCQCGAVRFAVSGAPAKISVCHCRMCQKASGAPFASFADIEHADFSWTRGKPAAFKSSSIAMRDFCADCGTRLTGRTAWYRRGNMAPNPGSAGWSASPICRARPRYRITARISSAASSATSIRTMIRGLQAAYNGP
jgi:hypothetical protein